LEWRKCTHTDAPALAVIQLIIKSWFLGLKLRRKGAAIPAPRFAILSKPRSESTNHSLVAAEGREPTPELLASAQLPLRLILLLLLIWVLVLVLILILLLLLVVGATL
jgi:hypothetical protein